VVHVEYVMSSLIIAFFLAKKASSSRPIAAKLISVFSIVGIAFCVIAMLKGPNNGGGILFNNGQMGLPCTLPPSSNL
jgi:hypothetical protein